MLPPGGHEETAALNASPSWGLRQKLTAPQLPTAPARDRDHPCPPLSRRLGTFLLLSQRGLTYGSEARLARLL